MDARCEALLAAMRNVLLWSLKMIAPLKGANFVNGMGLLVSRRLVNNFMTLLAMTQDIVNTCLECHLDVNRNQQAAPLLCQLAVGRQRQCSTLAAKARIPSGMSLVMSAILRAINNSKCSVNLSKGLMDALWIRTILPVLARSTRWAIVVTFQLSQAMLLYSSYVTFGTRSSRAFQSSVLAVNVLRSFVPAYANAPVIKAHSLFHHFGPA